MTVYKTFRDLDAWKRSRELVKSIYQATALLPKEEDFGIKLQMRRAAVSVVSNIAEGYGRQYKKEAIQFLFMSKGSLNELEAQVIVCEDLGYFKEEVIKPLTEQIETSRKLLSGYINYLEKTELK